LPPPLSYVSSKSYFCQTIKNEQHSLQASVAAQGAAETTKQEKKQASLQASVAAQGAAETIKQEKEQASLQASVAANGAAVTTMQEKEQASLLASVAAQGVAEIIKNAVTKRVVDCAQGADKEKSIANEESRSKVIGMRI